MSRSYDVVWEPDAIQSLLVLLTSAGRMVELAGYVDDLRSTLRHDPESKGALVAEGLRRIDHEEFVFLYSVHDDLTVRIDQVGLLED